MKWLALVVVCAAASSASAAAPPIVPSPLAAAEALRAFPAGATLVAFDPAGANHVWLATSVSAPAPNLFKLITNPQSYATAVPSFAKAEIVATQKRGHVEDRKVEWELEIPLWNLEGQLWIKPFDNAVQLRLSAGAFSPGAFLWRWSSPSPANTIATLEGSANARDANWGTRVIAKRSPLSEPAMTVAAAYTMLEGMMALCGQRPRRWPTIPMEPTATVSFAQRLADARTNLKVPGPLGLVIRQSHGRLSHVQVAVHVALLPKALLRALSNPERWHALPGWKKINNRSPVTGAAHTQRWQVDATFPFLDFDATWDVTNTSDALHAVASDGDAKGAVWSWEVLSDGAQGSVAVFALYPRIDRLGFLPRKFIEKEPLLESGLALALAYVNAVSLLNAIVANP